MIAQIGFKRLVLLLALAGLVGVCVFLNYVVFGPQQEESARTLANVRGEESALRTEIDQMRLDFETFEKRKETFDRLTRLGFFNDQDRLLARERFDSIQALSKVISARYEISPAVIVPAPIEGLAETGFVLVKTPVVLKLTAIDDLDIYRFLYYLTYGFPGHISISQMVIDRTLPVTPTVLKQIGTGTPPDLVNASISVEWTTLTRKEAMEPKNTSPVTNSVTGDPSGGQVQP